MTCDCWGLHRSPRKQPRAVRALDSAQWSSRISHKGFTDTFLLVTDAADLIQALAFTYALHLYYSSIHKSQSHIGYQLLYNNSPSIAEQIYLICVMADLSIQHNRFIGYQVYSNGAGPWGQYLQIEWEWVLWQLVQTYCYTLLWRVQMGSDIWLERSSFLMHYPGDLLILHSDP